MLSSLSATSRRYLKNPYLNSAQFYKNQYVNKLNKHLQIEISHNLQPVSYYLRIKETAKDLR